MYQIDTFVTTVFARFVLFGHFDTLFCVILMHMYKFDTKFLFGEPVFADDLPSLARFRYPCASGELLGIKHTSMNLNDFVESVVKASVFPATKYAFEIVSGIKVGSCRKPFAPLTAEQKKITEAAVEKVRYML